MGRDKSAMSRDPHRQAGRQAGRPLREETTYVSSESRNFDDEPPEDEPPDWPDWRGVGPDPFEYDR